MTEESLTELNRKIAVMEASKTQMIESRNTHRCSSGPTCWFASPDPDWDWDHCDYRVKPVEPRKLFVNYYPEGTGFIHDNYESAEDNRAPSVGVTVEFVELTPEVKSKLGL